MVSTTTVSREKKLEFLKEAQRDLIELILLEKRQRDPIRLTRFRKISNEIKEILEEARFVKSRDENSTKPSRIDPSMDTIGDEDL